MVPVWSEQLEEDNSFVVVVVRNILSIILIYSMHIHKPTLLYIHLN